MGRKFFVVFTLLFLLPALLFAQAGKLRGLVTDGESGDPLPGVDVFIENTNRRASTDPNGVYVLMGVPPGVYAVRAEYVGYRKTTISNIRVNAHLTTTLDFQLTSAALEMEPIEIVSERPLIQRNTTSTIRFHTQEDIRNLPIRGLENIIVLNAGTVLQDSELHIRGGRSGEVVYLIDGSNATNPFFNDPIAPVIQEAAEEIQFQAGGFTAEYGGANSGIVNTTIRTGGSRLSGTIDYRTDNIVKAGDMFLKTTSQGYHNVVATLGGPIPFTFNRVRFFLAGQYNYARNRSALFIEPFEFHPTNSDLPEWSMERWEAGERAFYAPWLVEDGFEGRSDIGEPLRNASGEVVPLKFERNFLPNNDTRSFTGNGTLIFDVSKAFRLLLTGSYYFTRQPEGGGGWLPGGWDTFYNALINYYSNREEVSTTNGGLVSLRATHIVNPNTFYDVGLSWSTRRYKNFDPRFGDAWWRYTDSRAWEERGFDNSEWDSIFFGPRGYSTIYNFNFTPPDEPKNDYSKESQTRIGGSLDFTIQLSKNIELKIGGRFDQWSMRSWSIGHIRGYMLYLYGRDAELWHQGGRKFEDRYDEEGNLLWTADYIRRVELTRIGSIDYYGWDYDGETKVDDGVYGPRRPFFASCYLQSKFEYRRLNLNIGFRYERIDIKSLKPVDYYTDPETGERRNGIEDPWMDTEYDWLDPRGVGRTEPHHTILPRFNISLPATDLTVFYASYGKYIQMPRLNQIYRGYRLLSQSVSPETRSPYGYWSSYVGYTAKPEEIVRYEMGFRQSLTDNFAVTVTGFYKVMHNLLRMDRVYSAGEGGIPEGDVVFCGYRNNDVGISKGLELTLELRRTKRMAVRVHYTLSDTRGTGSTMSSNDVVTSDAGDEPPKDESGRYYRLGTWDPQRGVYVPIYEEIKFARYPILMYPLDHNQTHRGSIILDYRLPRGDGGKILEGLGCSLLFTFNNGHAYTRVAETTFLGSASAWTPGTRMMLDNRNRYPVEPINSSTTPWNYTIDLTFEKMFFFGRFNVKLYTTVLNVLNKKNIINVYESTGTDNVDGWLEGPSATSFLRVPGFEPFYRTINLENGWAYTLATGRNLWGPPRQIRFGLMLEFH